MSMGTVLAIASGGALGALARYGVHRQLTVWHGADAAWSTLVVNAAGSFLLGIAAILLLDRQGALPPFVMVGLLGAFTTFSTFALDAVGLFRDRGLTAAGAYVGLSVVLSIGAFVVGGITAKAVS